MIKAVLLALWLGALGFALHAVSARTWQAAKRDFSLLTPPPLSDLDTRLIDVMTLGEEREFSCRFPAERWARVDITLNDGRIVRSEPVQARGDPERPLSDEALRDKYFDFAAPVLGRARAQRIERYIDALPDDDAFSMLLDELLRPA